MSEPQAPLVVRCTPELHYAYAAGRYGSLFLQGLKEGRILASRCRRCARTLVPPRLPCTGCFGAMEDAVELEPRGTLLAFTLVAFPFLDPFTGVQRPIPYCYGMVRFAGADNTFQYFLAEKDPRKLRVGQPMRAVFRPAAERGGEMGDLLYFEADDAGSTRESLEV